MSLEVLSIRGRRSTDDGSADPDEEPPVADHDGWRSWLPALRCALLWSLGVRVAALLVATGSRWMLQEDSTGPRPLGTWLDTWDRWDAANLAEIAHHGYLSATSDPAYPDSATAFFPGFPLAVRAIGWMFGGNLVLAGLVVSMVAGVVALAALYRLAEERFGHGAGRVAVALLACSPPGVFLVAGYSESLYLAGAIPAWYFASRDRWLAAGLTGAVAVATRTVGVLLAAGIAAEYLVRWLVGTGRLHRDADGLRGRLARLLTRVRPAEPDVAGGAPGGVAPPRRALAGLVVMLAPLAAWMAWLQWRAGDPLRFVSDQYIGWGRQLTGPAQAFQTTLRGALGNADTTWVFTWRLELIGAAIGIALVLWCLWRGEWGWSVYTGLTMAAYLLSTWYFSVPRGLLGMFPLPLLAAGVLWRRPQAFAIVLAVSATLFSLGVAVFVRGPWVG